MRPVILRGQAGSSRRPPPRTQVDDADLSSQLKGSMVKSQFEKTPFDFLPQCNLDAIITKDRIRHALSIREPSSPTDNQLLSFILGKAKKVFAITAFIELEGAQLYNAMSFFHNNGFDDRKLPIKEMSAKEIDDEAVGCWDKLIKDLDDDEVEEQENELWTQAFDAVDHPLISSEAPVKTENDRIWTQRRISKFQEAQKSFIAPVLSDAESNHDLDGQTVPFVKKYVTYAAGSFGEVSKYTIHKSHIIDTKRPNGVSYEAFAVKQIKPDNAVDRKKVADHWASEVRAMEMMNKLDHKGHIVHFVTAFSRGDPKEHYLITEWADGGNLQDLWKNRPKPKLNAGIVKSIVGQLLGIAEAFNAAHNLKSGGIATGASYRHGDLKPANILWFKPKSGDENDIGTLKICDWGEAKNKQFATAMRHSRTTAEFGTRRYQPPEVETGVGSMMPGTEDKRRSRLYDIWAVGCITLEFVIWLLYGLEGLNGFNSGVKNELNVESPFYQCSDRGSSKVAWVHNVVSYWMEHIGGDRACRPGSTALGDLLELVERGLLVVTLPREGGTFKPEDNQATETLTQPRRLTPQLNGATNGENPIPANPTTEGNHTTNIPTFNFDLADDEESDPTPVFLTPGPKRLRADQLCDRLTDITSSEEDEYWSIQSDTNIPNVPPRLYVMPPNTGRLDRVHQSQVDYGKGWVDPKKWSFKKDNTFASNLFSTFKDVEEFQVPAGGISERLCELCREFRDKIWSPVFGKAYKVEDLRNRAEFNECHLCKLFWDTCLRESGEWCRIFPEVTFERSIEFESALTMNGGRRPVLSICRGLDYCRKTNDLQIGFAELPASGSATHFEIIRQWLKDCDDKHVLCKPIPHIGKIANGDSPRLPTRLLDVGKIDDPTVRLWETSLADRAEWLALSHRWGPKPHFSTTTENREAHIAGIAFDKLPATFRDAVLVTRALGCRYLWIDSICIVQEGKDADFDKEAKRMEEVYSGAQCVIAASCASSHGDGFLKPRPKKRNYVGLRGEQDNDAPFYICEMIDNFKAHILDGPMNKRGWVLQEHALARRSIFFDEHQTYWECGHGIRCETMNTLQNDWAKLLGDPNFPQIIDPAKQAERILRFQILYEDYSRLGLSKPYDRPAGIAGLEQRLLRTMHVQGRFGILDDPKALGLLRRSLLWHRGKDSPRLHRITFPSKDLAVPSWSWMAWTGEKHNNGMEYPGGINYFKLPFDQFDWENTIPPWSKSTCDEDDILIADARTFDRNAAHSGELRFIYDCPGESEHKASMCVVLGVQVGESERSERRHYGIVIVRKEEADSNSNQLWERVGAGYLLGRHLGEKAISVRIC